jgi:hypothetical protein
VVSGTIAVDGEKSKFSRLDGSLWRRCCPGDPWCLRAPNLGLGRGGGAVEGLPAASSLGGSNGGAEQFTSGQKMENDGVTGCL